MSLVARVGALLAKAQHDLWGNLSPQHNPELMAKRVRAQRSDGTSYMTTVYVRRDTGEPAKPPTLPTPQQPAIDFGAVPQAAEPAAKPNAEPAPKPKPKPEPPAEPTAEEPKDFDDAGAFIPGARKELTALREELKGRGLALGDLDTLASEAGALESMVTKAAVAGPTLKQQLRASGLTPGAAYLWWKAWSSIRAKPVRLSEVVYSPWSKDKRYDDPAHLAKLYAIGARRLLDLLATPKDAEAMHLALKQLGQERRGLNLTPAEHARYQAADAERERAYQARTAITREFQRAGEWSDQGLAWHAREELRTGQPRRPEHVPPAAWDELKRVIQAEGEAIQATADIARQAREARAAEEFPMSAALACLGGNLDTFMATTSSRSAGNTRYRARKEALAYEKADDWSWLEPDQRDARDTDAAGKKRKPKWERTGPDAVLRVGGKLREFTSQDLIEVFGIRGVQYGNYVDEQSAREHTQRAGEAFLDLADILGIDAGQVSLKGRLGMAFGARGSGNFAAHYEPAQTVINMTKNAGGGSLAHEWGHLLDNVLMRVVKDNPQSMEFMTDKALAPRFARTSHVEVTGDPVIDAAWDELRAAIYRGSVGARVKVKVPFKHAYRPWRPGDEWLARYDGDVDLAMQRLVASKEAALTSDSSYRRKHAVKELRGMAQYFAFKGNKTMEYELPADRSKTSSAFVATARAMGEYWQRPVELFARAFETWVQDELAASGRQNTYLVSGISKDDAKAWSDANPMDLDGGPSSPYPLGAEREAITSAMGKLMRALRAQGMLAKAAQLLTEGRR